jgi:hypothetical protein
MRFASGSGKRSSVKPCTMKIGSRVGTVAFQKVCCHHTDRYPATPSTAPRNTGSTSFGSSALIVACHSLK